jgi:hypothetical protein
MKQRLAVVMLISAVGLAGVLPSGCSSEESSNFNNANSSGASGGAGASGGFGDSDGGGSGVVKPFASMRIEPEDAVIDVELGQTTPQKEYKVFGKRTATSVEEEVPAAQLAFDRIDVATVSGRTLSPTGFIGGKGTLVAKLLGSSAQTSASFRLRTTVGTAPDPNVLSAMETATDADAQTKVIYPYDKTVFPRGVPGPVVQWNGVTGNNSYRLLATSSTFVLTAYATSTGDKGELAFPTAPTDLWARLADSTAGDVTVELQRHDGTKAFKPVKQAWSIAAGNLKSTVYYTRLIRTSDSFVRRIEPGKIAESFLKKQDEQCVACHSISRNGERMVGSINGGDSPWAVWDVRSGTKLYQSTQSSGLQAISPAGDFVLWRHWNSGFFGTDGKLYLSAYNNDAKLAELAPPAAMGAPSHPVWSPDGKMVSIGLRTSGNGINYNAATLALVDVTLGTAPGFSAIRQIVAANATFPVATYPTFSPDSKWVGFMRANKAIASDGDSKAELWVTDLTGGTQIRLDLANGGGVLAATDQNWGPSFHPVAAGGYFWLAFYARRSWGHRFTGSNQQLWIAAVDANPTPGKDPSHPAFYVQGQELDSINERPQFAVPPCKKSGETCASGYECCDGKFCRSDGMGKLTCQEPKANECAQTSDSCKVDADCCNSLKCVGATCQPLGPR